LKQGKKPPLEKKFKIKAIACGNEKEQPGKTAINVELEHESKPGRGHGQKRRGDTGESDCAKKTATSIASALKARHAPLPQDPRARGLGQGIEPRQGFTITPLKKKGERMNEG